MEWIKTPICQGCLHWSIQYAEQHNIVNDFLTVAFHLIVELLGETAQYDVPTEDKLTSPHQLTINQLMIL
jgi:hypothetical protein